MADFKDSPNHDGMLDLHLALQPEKLVGFEQALGAGGIGTFIIPRVLDTEQITVIQAEVFDPTRVSWRDNHDRFTNGRGIEVIENHTVFALKLHRGDQTLVQKVPGMRQLATEIEQFVRIQADTFPSLAEWTADEMSLHRYDDQEIGLSFHKDNLRFIGVIAVLGIEGENDFAVLDTDGQPHIYPIEEGDLVVTRATGLYSMPLAEGKQQNLCPDHAVLHLKTPYKTSFIVRDNNRSAEELVGFEYDNWKPD